MILHLLTSADLTQPSSQQTSFLHLNGWRATTGNWLASCYYLTSVNGNPCNQVDMDKFFHSVCPPGFTIECGINSQDMYLMDDERVKLQDAVLQGFQSLFSIMKGYEDCTWHTPQEKAQRFDDQMKLYSDLYLGLDDRQKGAAFYFNLYKHPPKLAPFFKKDWLAFYPCDIDPKKSCSDQRNLRFIEHAEETETSVKKELKFIDTVSLYFRKTTSLWECFIYNTLGRILLWQGKRKAESALHVWHGRYTRIGSNVDINVIAPESGEPWQLKLGQFLFPALTPLIQEHLTASSQDHYKRHKELYDSWGQSDKKFTVQHLEHQTLNDHDCVRFSSVYMMYDMLGISPDTLTPLQVYLGFKFLELQHPNKPRSKFVKFVSWMWRKPADWLLQWVFLTSEQKNFLRTHLIPKSSNIVS